MKLKPKQAYILWALITWLIGLIGSCVSCDEMSHDNKSSDVRKLTEIDLLCFFTSILCRDEYFCDGRRTSKLWEHFYFGITTPLISGGLWRVALYFWFSCGSHADGVVCILVFSALELLTLSLFCVSVLWLYVSHMDWLSLSCIKHQQEFKWPPQTHHTHTEFWWEILLITVLYLTQVSTLYMLSTHLHYLLKEILLIQCFFWLYKYLFCFNRSFVGALYTLYTYILYL